MSSVLLSLIWSNSSALPPLSGVLHYSGVLSLPKKFFLKAPSYITQLAFTKKSWATPSWKFKPMYLHLKVNCSWNSPCSASWLLKGERKEYYFSYQSFTAFYCCNMKKTKIFAAIRKQTSILLQYLLMWMWQSCAENESFCDLGDTRFQKILFNYTIT